MAEHVLVIGAGRGIGLEVTKRWAARGDVVFAATRSPSRELFKVAADFPSVRVCAVDLTDEATIAALAAEIGKHTSQLHRVLITAGVLHGEGFGPERKLEELELEAMQRVFAVNAFGPILVAKHLRGLLKHKDRCVFATISARVGSIEDNKKGGWYAYRASKAAQNQFSRTLAIEFGRRAANCIVLSLHPGTVNTDLSKPFQRFVPPHKLFSVERAAGQLIDIIDGATPKDSGSFIAWDGSPIPW